MTIRRGVRYGAETHHHQRQRMREQQDQQLKDAIARALQGDKPAPEPKPLVAKPKGAK